ncbi:methyl-accepting chemotaxis protein [Stenomitos frigidus]|uniref:Chemotaxis protein n=1 Tax=Stenomitos frigidus ULC18 TaxID=2107698 RepID=A0A2T1DSR6_9CYAN|nr:methyl-accepting chemotaxis protein [Stenomitos frigidus]PSB23543.1 chemotaxis protein [Stenomitos frigidus ULC18]
MTPTPNSSPQNRLTHQSFDAIQADRTITDGLPAAPLWPIGSSKHEATRSPTWKEVQPELETLQQFPIGSSNWWQRLSVRTKAVFIAMTIGTFPILFVGTTTYLVTNQSIQQQVLQAEETSALDLEGKLNNFMDERYSDIQAFAQLNLFADSKLRYKASLAEKQKALEQYTRSARIGNVQVYDSVVVADLDGNVLAKSKDNPQNPQPSKLFDRDYFQAVLKADKPIIGYPQTSIFSNEFSIFTVAPIKDSETGQTIAIIRARIPLSVLKQVFGETAVSGEAFFLKSSENQIIAASDPTLIQKKVADEFPNVALQNEQKQTAVTARAAGQNREVITYLPNQELSKAYNLKWGLLITRPVAIAFLLQRQLLLTTLLGTGGIALIVAAIATGIATRATRPVLNAAEAVGKIGQGDLAARVAVEGEDEIASLGININSMAVQLQESLNLQAFEAAQERLITAAKGSNVVQAADLQVIFDEAVEGARQLFNFDRIVIYRLRTNSNAGIVAESVDSNWSTALDEGVSDSCIPEELRAAYQAGRVVATNDVSISGFHPEHLNLLKRLQVKASLITPIVGAGQLYGLLIAHYCSTTYNWQESEINFLQRLGNELALSIYRVELLEQTTNLAEEQRELKEGLQKRALELLLEVDPISKGDLTTQAKVTADEIGTIADSYNATVDSLRKIVQQVQVAANQVSVTTNASQVSVQSLSEEALRQAEAIAAALKVAEETAIVVRQVAVNTERAEMAVQEAAQSVEEGDAAMNRTVDGIMAIRATVADTAKKVKHLGESSQKISTVVDLIGSFAAQTNMLALNAAIEASRAGEEGRGFAVVADEVRTLARQSAEATEEIRKLVVSIQAETNEVVTAMESGTEQVVIGTQLVNETRQSLNKITAVSAQISALVEAIAQATVVQSQASEEVTQTMKDVAAIANRTSTEAGQVSSSFEELRKVAQTLQAEVGQFKV